MTDVLLVDIDPDRCAALKSYLEPAGLSVSERVVPPAPSAAEINIADCVICTADLLSDLGADHLMGQATPCIFVDHVGDARRAVTAMKAGAADYLVAPFNAKELIQAVEQNCLTAPNKPATRPLNMVGFSKPMTDMFDLIRKVGPTESAVLIEGESGTGKELVARALHSASRRNQAPLITLNCATTPTQLIESELFGYPEQEGPRKGLVQAASGGTLFLDEIGELPASVQARLQQLLEFGTIKDLDSGTAQHVDVRLISATHRNLQQLIDNDLFRHDLFYRINVVNIVIPPLRQRGDDILRIAETFLEQTTKRLARQCSGLSESARAAMLSYHWPGNVRELENAIERAVILCGEGEINEALLAIEVNHEPLDAASKGSPDQTSLEDYFVSFVTTHQDQLTETELAQKLGISRKSLWERRQRLNIPRKRTKKRGPRRDSP